MFRSCIEDKTQREKVIEKNFNDNEVIFIFKWKFYLLTILGELKINFRLFNDLRR